MIVTLPALSPTPNTHPPPLWIPSNFAGIVDFTLQCTADGAPMTQRRHSLYLESHSRLVLQSENRKF